MLSAAASAALAAGTASTQLEQVPVLEVVERARRPGGVIFETLALLHHGASGAGVHVAQAIQ